MEAPPELLAPFDREGRDRERTFQSGAWGRLLRVQPVQLPDRDPRRILVDQFHLLPRFRDPPLHDPIFRPEQDESWAKLTQKRKKQFRRNME